MKRDLPSYISITVFKGVQLPAETKKTGHKFEHKDTVTGSGPANAAQKPEGILRSQKENISRCDSISQWHAWFFCFYRLT